MAPDGGTPPRRTTGTPRPLTVFLIDAQRSFGEALGLAIEAERDLRYVGWAETSHDALRLIEIHKPNVVIIDVAVTMPTTEGIHHIRSISPSTEVVVLSSDPSLANGIEAKEAGAAATLSKHASVAEILSMIRRFGPAKASPEDASSLSDTANEAARIVRKLTPRELQVLELMGTGLDPRGIGKHLEISISTSRDYVKRILSKFEVHTQLEAVIKASRLGLLSL